MDICRTLVWCYQVGMQALGVDVTESKLILLAA